MSIVHGKPEDLVFHVCSVKNIFIGKWDLILNSFTLSFFENLSQCTLLLSCNAVKGFSAVDDSNSTYFQQETPLAILGVNAKAGDIINTQLSYSRFPITHPQTDIRFTFHQLENNQPLHKNITCTLLFDILRTS